MDIKMISNKKKEELRKIKEEEKKLLYDKFVEELDELYYDLYSDDYGEFYNFFMELLNKKFYCVEKDIESYNEFKGFINRNSNHMDDFKEERKERYLDDESSEEEEEEDRYEFLMKNAERY